MLDGGLVRQHNTFALRNTANSARRQPSVVKRSRREQRGGSEELGGGGQALARSVNTLAGGELPSRGSQVKRGGAVNN